VKSSSLLYREQRDETAEATMMYNLSSAGRVHIKTERRGIRLYDYNHIAHTRGRTWAMLHSAARAFGIAGLRWGGHYMKASPCAQLGDLRSHCAGAQIE
jgi:hypothetical protein